MSACFTHNGKGRLLCLPPGLDSVQRPDIWSSTKGVHFQLVELYLCFFPHNFPNFFGLLLCTQIFVGFTLGPQELQTCDNCALFRLQHKNPVLPQLIRFSVWAFGLTFIFKRFFMWKLWLHKILFCIRKTHASLSDIGLGDLSRSCWVFNKSSASTLTHNGLLFAFLQVFSKPRLSSLIPTIQWEDTCSYGVNCLCEVHQ